MRLVFQFVRTACHRSRYSSFARSRQNGKSQSSFFNSRRACFRPPTPYVGTRTILSLLSPAAFVALSEAETVDGKTPEQHMLEASRAEIAKAVPKDVHGLTKVARAIYLGLDIYIIEPIATALRFFHLVFIFVPVLVTAPTLYFGNSRWWYGFLVRSMERAGPTFIKLGQWAASRTDIFPDEMCRIMSSLHSNAPAHSLSFTKRTIEKAFGGRPFGSIFDEFQEKPLGVGAIAQVYKAKLKPELTATDEAPQRNMRQLVDRVVKSSPQRLPSPYVAIKVLHPKVERMVRRDLRIMSVFAAIINAIPTLEWFDFPNEVTQFGEMMRLQLDLRIEAANLSMFRKKFRDRTTAWFPYPYAEHTSRQVLVEEFASGIPLSAFLEDGGGVFEKEIADEGLDAFLHMLLIDNFVHADLHPGNIMVRFYKPAEISRGHPPVDEEDVTEKVLEELRPFRHNPSDWVKQLDHIDREGYRPQLIFIDAGLVTALNETNRRNFLDLFKAVAEFDGYRAGHLMVERCRQPAAVIDPEIFALRMQHLVLGVKSRTFALGNIKIGDVLNEVLSMVRGHHVRMEGDFVNVVISILLLEGIGRTLDPNLDLFKSALPILRQLSAQGARGGGLLKTVRQGDTSMLKVWVGLEARKFLQASADQVEACVYLDRLSPNI